MLKQAEAMRAVADPAQREDAFMPRLAHWARLHPDKPACCFPDLGAVVSYAALHARADRAARWLVGLGLEPGSAFAMMMENHPAVFELAFAGQRAGLYWVPLNTHLKPAELAYVLRDSGARVLVASPAQAHAAKTAVAAMDDPASIRIYVLDGSQHSAGHYEAELAGERPTALPPRPVGRDLLYSSGTTSLPKGVYRALRPAEGRDQPRPAVGALLASGFDASTVYLSPAPLYHAAPHRFTLHAIEQGGTCVVMQKFDPEQALGLIERHHVTHAQFVPTMFVRLLALPEPVRRGFDCTSLRRVIHAAAPCPVPVKEAMIAWWGPIIYEYYSGSEAIGGTGIEGADWLLHKGSVGRATHGTVHVTDDDGRELPPGAVGTVRFSGTPRFEYLNAAEKTQAAYDRNGWASYGDLGWLDADDYLYLSDRRADLIISGGVNVYPQEVEDTLAQHPDVADAAVIGIADAEYGERVKAVVQLREGAGTTPEGLVAFCRERLAHMKCPRSVDIIDALPRSETGKLLRRVLKEQYRPSGAKAG